MANCQRRQLERDPDASPRSPPCDDRISIQSGSGRSLNASSSSASNLHTTLFSHPQATGRRNHSSIRYAKIAHLSSWFPEADPSHERAQTFRTWLSRRRTILLTACTTSTIVCLVNLIGTIVMYTKLDNGRLFHGKCNTSGMLSSTLHLGINILSSILLGASNLAMQLLSAPTREEIDAAHSKREWLDIGILAYATFVILRCIELLHCVC